MMRMFLIVAALLLSFKVGAHSAEGAVYRDNGAHASGYRDTDHDGVLDFRDVCPRSPKVIRVDQFGCAIAGGDQPSAAAGCRVDHRSGLGRPLLTPAFAVASADLTPRIRRTLRAFAAALPRLPEHVQLVGFADPRGLAAHNEALSLRRALAVRAFLAELSWPAGRIAVRGMGEDPGAAWHSGRTRREVRIHLSFEHCGAAVGRDRAGAGTRSIVRAEEPAAQHTGPGPMRGFK